MIRQDLLKQIDLVKLSDRAQKSREEFLAVTPRIHCERDVVAMNSWKVTEGDPLVIRRARLLKSVLENVPVVIFRGQRLAGNETRTRRGAYYYCDYDDDSIWPFINEARQEGRFGGGIAEKEVVSRDVTEALAECAEFWKGKSPAEKARRAIRELVGPWYEDLCEAGVADYSCFPHVSGAPLMERIIGQGLRSFIEEAEKRKNEWLRNRDKDVDKFYFWQASIISLKAAIDYSKRYAKLAREMATNESDEAVRLELNEIARTCEWVPENPARTYREALQCICMIEMVSKLETPVGPFTGFGLMDQYLYPYFIKDLDEGRLTVQDAVDLMADFLLFANHIEYLETRGWREGARKGVLTSISLAGPNVGREEDGSNEVTYLILHAVGLTRYPEPHIAFRWSKYAPRWIMIKALEANVLVGGGVPQFQNSDQAVEYMVERGVSRENALGWITHGCSQGNSADQRTGLTVSRYNIPLCLDLALHNGVVSKTGKRVGIETGDPRDFKTFEDTYGAFARQLEYIFTRQTWLDNVSDEVKAQCHAEPFASSILPGCLENGCDFGAGGLTHYRLRFQKDRGIVPAADSLMAMKKLVYEDKKVTVDELLTALDSNFEGPTGEAIRRLCLSAPKYGNDEDGPDLMARQVAATSGGTILSQQSAFGYPLAMNRDGQAWHFFAGKRLGALPNGRKSGEVLPDGSLSAMQGMDRKGPTALLNSVLKADSKSSSAFAVLNVKLTAGLVTTQETREKVVDLIETFFRAGGTYIQFNILDANTLKDARKHPEKYRDLVVRVGGYSAYFINLSPEVQDEIIQRTEYRP